MSVLRRYVEQIAAPHEDRDLLEKVAYLTSMGIEPEQIYRALQQEGFSVNLAEVYDITGRLLKLHAKHADFLFGEELSSYLLTTAALQDDLTNLLQTLMTNYRYLLAGIRTYPDSDRRIPPVASKEILSLAQAIEKLNRGRVAALNEFNPKPARTATQALPEPSVLEAQFINVLEPETEPN